MCCRFYCSPPVLPPAVDRIYAQHVAQQAGEGGGGGDEGGILSQLSDADRRDMQRWARASGRGGWLRGPIACTFSNTLKGPGSVQPWKAPAAWLVHARSSSIDGNKPAAFSVLVQLQQC